MSQKVAMNALLAGKPTHPMHTDNGNSLSTMRISGVVAHHMAGSLAGTDAWFGMSLAQRNAAFEKAHIKAGGKGLPPTAFRSGAHFGIGRHGELHSYRLPPMIAYHAGVTDRTRIPNCKAARKTGGEWENPNQHLIGIEHETNENGMLAPVAYLMSAALISVLAVVFNFVVDEYSFCGHSQLANTACPGKIDLKALLAGARTEYESLAPTVTKHDELGQLATRMIGFARV
jgi:hypothetical protein